MARALARAGHDVTVVATPTRGVWEHLDDVPAVRRVAATFSSTFDRQAMAVLDELLAVRRPDHVFAVFEQDYRGTLRTARRHGVPVTLFLHHAGMRRTNRLLLPLLRAAFVVPSDDLRAWLCDRRVAERRVHVLANPIDSGYFRPDEAVRARAREAFGFTADDIVVGFVGRIEHDKGIIPFAHALNRAMQRQPRLRALWVGFGRREGELDAILSAADEPAHHVRAPWRTDVHPLYCAMDLLALPSTGRESFGRTLVEAQACMVPVLGSDIGGIPMTMLHGTTGELVPAGDVDRWADAILRLSGDAARRIVMGHAGRAHVRERFDCEVVVRELLAYVATRASGKTGPAHLRAAA